MTNRTAFKLAAIWLTLAISSSLGAVSPSSNVENTKLTPAPSSDGAVYREARGYRVDDGDNYYNPRQYERPQSRCISCLYATMAGNPDRNRYFDQFYYNYRPAYGPQRENEDRNWYYQPDRYENRYDNRHAPYENRGSYPSMQSNRYGDNNRYDQYRPGYGNYDRNDNRQNYQDYRGNGYDNRDPMYYNSMKGGQYGGGSNNGMGSTESSYGSGIGGVSYAPGSGTPGYGSGSGSLSYGSGSSGTNYAPGSGSYGNRDGGYESNYYDNRMSNRGYNSMAGAGGTGGTGGAGYGSPNYYMRPNINENRPEYYDRNNNGGYGMSNTGYRGGYGGNSYSDERIFRPWDQTNRGVSGFDNLGHGHYFASNPVQPQLPQTSSHQQAPPRPFGSGGQYHHDASSHLPYSPYSPYSPNSPNSPNTPNAYQYDAGHGHNKYGTNTNNNKGGGGSGTSSYGGNWHYVNSNNDHHNLNHQQSGYSQQSHHVDKDSQQSSPYGDRQGQRPLSTSYLHERDTPTIVGKDNGSDASDTNQTKNTSNNEENQSDNNNNRNTNNDYNGTLKRPNEETSTNNIATFTNANDA